MKIHEIGGEFALIDRLSAIAGGDHVDIVQGVGDDAAVLRVAPEPAPYLLVTTDILVEHRHFKTEWADAEQVGEKASECNVSDIAAMGGTPTWMFVSLVLAEDTQVQWAEGLYRGIARSCQRHGILVVGGDTTQGGVNTVNIALLGSVDRKNLSLRSQARPGDLLMVTGTLGASAAGLAMLLENRQPSDYLLQKHLTPRCRLDAAHLIAPLANAMIDISDGLGSEVHHICNQSKVCAEIEAAAIPLHGDVVAAGKALGIKPYQFALSGGEDFELLFTIDPQKIEALTETGLNCHPVGKITAQSDAPLLIQPDGTQIPLPGGYNHFQT